MNTKKMATAAVIVLPHGKATFEPLYSGKDLMELYPKAEKIILFPSVSEAAMYAQNLERGAKNEMSKQRENYVKRVREKYPAGTVLELDYMDDVQAPPKGSRMTVTYVDDMGTIHGNWDNGSTIGLVPSCDRFHVVDTEALEPDRSK